MPGVRLHHVDLRNSAVVFELPDRPYPTPFLCSTCSKAHTHKAVHLRVDNDGDVCVAEESFEVIRQYLGPDWKVMNLIETPPPMVLGFDGKQEQFHVEFREV
jgi:hypothetical protein